MEYNPGFLLRADTLSALAEGGAYRFANGSAAAPSISFASDPDTGFWAGSDNVLRFSAGGVTSLLFQGSGVIRSAPGYDLALGTGNQGTNIALRNSGAVDIAALGTNQSITLTPSGTGSITSTSDAFLGLTLTRGSTATGGRGIQIINGNAQSWVLGVQGSTGTPASGFSISTGTDFSSNHFNITTGGSVLLGTNTSSANGRLQLATHTTNAGGIGFGTETSLHRVQAGHLAIDHIGGTNPKLLFRENGTAGGDIQTSAGDFYITSITGKPIYFRTNGGTVALTLDAAQNATFASAVWAGIGGSIGFNGRAVLRSSADGVMRLTNWGGTDFSRLQFGGTTSSFPALKRSGTALQVRLADDSGGADLFAANFYFANAASGVRDSTGVSTMRFGTGSPEGSVTAAPGSLFLNLSGGTGTTLYVKESGIGDTGWVAK